jgi:hypothetical protein
MVICTQRVPRGIEDLAARVVFTMAYRAAARVTTAATDVPPESAGAHPCDILEQRIVERCIDDRAAEICANALGVTPDFYGGTLLDSCLASVAESNPPPPRGYVVGETVSDLLDDCGESASSAIERVNATVTASAAAAIASRPHEFTVRDLVCSVADEFRARAGGDVWVRPIAADIAVCAGRERPPEFFVVHGATDAEVEALRQELCYIRRPIEFPLLDEEDDADGMDVSLPSQPACCIDVRAIDLGSTDAFTVTDVVGEFFSKVAARSV